MFRADCGVHAVVVMATARYGRMEKGRCVQNNLGYLGCHTDVLRYSGGLNVLNVIISIMPLHPLPSKSCHLKRIISTLNETTALLITFVRMYYILSKDIAFPNITGSEGKPESNA